MIRKMRLLVAAALTIGISVPADAEENFELLKAKQIRARVVGKDIRDGTGAITKAEKITDAEDLDAAATQKAAMEKATTSLVAATQKAVVANAGYQAVSITPEMREGHPTAGITLMQGETVKNVTVKLD